MICVKDVSPADGMEKEIVARDATWRDIHHHIFKTEFISEEVKQQAISNEGEYVMLL